MVEPCFSSNLNWKGNLFCLPDILQGIGSTGSLEDLYLGSGALGYGALGMDPLVGGSLGTGPLMGVETVWGFDICLRYCSPVS